MHTKADARELAKDLAMELGSFSEVLEELRTRGYGGLLSDEELEEIVLQAKVGMNVRPKRKCRTIVRIVGIVAIIMGVSAILIHMSSSGMPIPARHYSPAGMGWIAIAIGIVLVIFPDSAQEKL